MSLPTIPGFTLGQKAKAQDQQDQSDAITWALYRAYGTYGQQTAAQSIANASDVAVQWNANIRQYKVTHSTVTNNSRVTPNEPGLYLVTVTVQFASDATGYRKVWFRQNGSGTEGSVQQDASGSGETALSMTSILYFNGSSDYVETMVRHTRGSALDLGFGEFNPRLSVLWQSAL